MFCISPLSNFWFVNTFLSVYDFHLLKGVFIFYFFKAYLFSLFTMSLMSYLRNLCLDGPQIFSLCFLLILGLSIYTHVLFKGVCVCVCVLIWCKNLINVVATEEPP